MVFFLNSINNYSKLMRITINLILLFWVGAVWSAQPEFSANDLNSQQAIDNLANLIRNNPQLQQQLRQAMGQQTTTVSTTSMVNGQANNQTIVQNQSTNHQPSLAVKQPQSALVKSASPTPQALEEEVSASAFKAVKQEAFPLTPDQIISLRERLDDTQRAAAMDPYQRTPEPTSSSLLVNLSPGSTPPVIRLARGFVTSLVFVDATGAPWPIKAYDLGNPNAFNISWNQKDNTLFVQALVTYTYGNLAVVLKDLDTPVMLTLVPGQMVVDYRVDLRLSALGPNAKPSIVGTGLPGQADPVLLSILDGIPPKGAKRLTVEANSGEAWVLGDKIYVRTLYNLISPAWVAKMSSADGMNAYLMQRTPMILLSRYGKIAQVRLEGF